MSAKVIEMLLTEPIMTVVGFFNPRGKDRFPCGLMTIVTTENDPYIYAVDGKANLYLLVDEPEHPTTFEKASTRRTFTAVAQGTIIQSTKPDQLTSYGIGKDNIVVGTLKQIFDRIEHAVIHKQYRGEHLEELTEVYDSMKIRLNGMGHKPL